MLLRLICMFDAVLAVAIKVFENLKSIRILIKSFYLHTGQKHIVQVYGTRV